MSFSLDLARKQVANLQGMSFIRNCKCFLSLFKPNSCDVTWKRDVPWMFALSNFRALPDSLLQDHWSQKIVQHLWVLSFFPAIVQREILQMDCLDCSAETRKRCCWISLNSAEAGAQKIAARELVLLIYLFCPQKSAALVIHGTLAE